MPPLEGAHLRRRAPIPLGQERLAIGIPGVQVVPLARPVEQVEHPVALGARVQLGRNVLEDVVARQHDQAHGEVHVQLEPPRRHHVG